MSRQHISFMAGAALAAATILAFLVMSCGGDRDRREEASLAPAQEVTLESSPTQVSTVAPEPTATSVPPTQEPTQEPTQAPPQAPSQTLDDRTDCNLIRGTDYRSASERDWFIQNCRNTTTAAAAPQPAPSGGQPQPAAASSSRVVTTPSIETPRDLGSAVDYYNRGLSYARSGDYARAKSDFDKAIGLNPGYQAAFYQRGVANEFLNAYGAAIDDYTRAIQLLPTDATAHYRRGITYSKASDYRNALADYSRAIEINPGYGAVYQSRANLYLYNFNDPARAVPDYTKCIELIPNNASFTPYCYSSRGVAQERLGNKAAAIADLEKAQQLFLAAGNTAAANSVGTTLARLKN